MIAFVDDPLLFAHGVLVYLSIGGLAVTGAVRYSLGNFWNEFVAGVKFGELKWEKA